MRWIIIQIVLLWLYCDANRRGRPVIRPCRSTTHRCAHLCRNINGVDKCVCYSGFKMLRRNRKDCADINECQKRNGGCQHNCTNTFGGHHCSCRPGYVLAANGKRCLRQNPVCPPESHQCDHFCNVTRSGQECYCRRGYRLHSNGRECIRLCNAGNGGCYHRCNDEPDRTYCTCHTNYVLHSNGHTCSAPHTCAVDNGGCNVECEDTPIGVQCSCKNGYLLRSDRRSCQDVDECATDNGGCEHGCRNSQGSFICTCPDGFKLAADERACVDIDECLQNDTCWSGCVNSPGSYECTCGRGFEKFAVKRCGDKNECTVNNGGCAHVCTNKKGGYECSCNVGYKLHWNKKDCVRESRCLSARGDNPPAAFIRCQGRNCLLDCKTESFFRAYLAPKPSYRYLCGRYPPRNNQADGRRTRTTRGGVTSPVTTRNLWQVANLEINDTLPDCPDALRGRFYAAQRLQTDHCHLQRQRASNALASSSLRGVLGSIAITCQTPTRRGKATLMVEMEVIVRFPRNCNARCKKKRKIKTMKKVVGSIKRGLKKQVFRISAASAHLRILKRSLTRRMPNPGIRSPSRCLYGNVPSVQNGRRSCKPCESGTYFDAIALSCSPCSSGTYQDKYGQLSCKPCLREVEGESGPESATLITQCQGVCLPGHFSSDGFLPCQPCPLGTYQPERGRIACFQCGNGMTTRGEGLVSFSGCTVRVTCTSGHFYNIQTASCGRCPIGFYQPDRGQDFCHSCPGNTTTDYDASSGIESCKDTRCGEVIGDFHGVIESPNYPGEYPINAHCTWVLKPPKKRKLLVVIPEIFLPGEDCADALIMKTKKTGGSVIYESCQTFENPVPITVRSKKLLIEFRSNDNIGARGFQIPYVTYDENYDEIIQDIVRDPRLSSADHHQNILKDKESRQTLFHVLADPEMYFNISPQIKKLFPASFVAFLREKVTKFFSSS